MAITKTYDLLNINGVKGWIRDSWARRAIAALQQRVAAIVVPTKTSDLTNDSGFITSADIPPGAAASTTTPLMDGTAAVGTENAFARGDHRHPTDTSRQAALSASQLAAVNSGVTAAKVAAWDGITVPTKTSELTNDSGYVTASAIPTKTSDLTNDSGYVTASAIPTETSDLTNDSGFITAADIPAIPSKTSDLTNDSNFQTGTQVDDAISAEAGLMVPYGYCTIAAGTVAKTVTVSPAVTALTAGLCIAVKFQYANTATNPTLTVNGLGAKAIKRYGTTAAGTSAAANWNANSVVILVYDGSYWMLADWNNTTYSGMTDAEYQAGTSTTNRLITPARLKAAIELHAPVQSVNGQTGAVTVTVPTKTSDLTNDSGYITSAPVTSVNGQTGVVSLDASDVGALPDSTVIPSKTSQLTNDSGYITSVPVTSVNGKTGAVSLDASDVGALPSSTAIPSKTSDLTNDSGYITASAIPSVPSPSTTNPAMDGTASAGSSTSWSRGDHVHPHDTSKADKATTLSGYGITNAYTKTEVDGMIPTVPTNVSAFTNDVGYITASAVPDASSATPAMDGTGAAGSSADYARADHVHPNDTSKQDALTAAQLAAVNSGITADDLAINDPSVLCAVTPIEPTLSAGAHYDTFGRCWYFKIGHRVRVHIGVSGLTANTTTTLWTMPAGYRPYSSVSFTGQSSSYSNIARCRVLENGEVRVSAASTYATAYMEFDAFA